jgi:hypothetical protein
LIFTGFDFQHPAGLAEAKGARLAAVPSQAAESTTSPIPGAPPGMACLRVGKPAETAVLFSP